MARTAGPCRLRRMNSNRCDAAVAEQLHGESAGAIGACSIKFIRDQRTPAV